MIPKEVFLSHSSRDRAIANRMAATLRAHGVPVWYSDTNIATADQWIDAIGAALRRCDWFMVLLSPASAESRWVKRELSYALRHRQYDEHLIPVIVEACDYEELSWTLGELQMASLDDNPEEGFAKILRRWGIGFDPAKASS